MKHKEKNQKLTCTVDSEHAGKRLDIAVALMCPEYSRSQIKRVIESNELYVNGNVEYRANYKVQKNDSIEFEIEKEDVDDRIVPENIPLTILYEDEDLLAINKPIGMVVHPATGNWTGTVMNGLMYKYSELEDVGQTIRSGLIHRLDKDTSGLLLVGKTNKGLWHYSRLFSERKVKKRYLAITSGNLPDSFAHLSEFEVRNYVARHSVNRKKMHVVGDLDMPEQDRPSDVRIAHTKFSKISSKGKNIVYIVEPKTGRTHQIRIHSKYLHSPIVGDKIYGGVTASRMMLHAFSLELTMPDGKTLYIQAEPDDLFKEYLANLGVAYEYIQDKFGINRNYEIVEDSAE
ncbi:RluA family pseudouridine synthase [Candidatus Dojkabacteria bacterium]|uniref:Pseudouridine synthase n=1 Tax=Candidatus Dojkabacteria bacterium TaxID=2099670 RepID=A0A955L7I4_9BACT|nr:RluA family pseudouridine synthase [Candidatus Dojkabacteria bacterium]